MKNQTIRGISSVLGERERVLQMAIIGDALRQAFMSNHEYDSLRDEDKAWIHLRRPLLICGVALILLAIVVSTSISLNIVFPRNGWKRPFCSDLRLHPLSINATASAAGNSDLFSGSYSLTDQETVDYFWTVLFLPSFMLIIFSVVYLLAGITVASSSHARHWSLSVVENNYCASRRGGVRCLCIINRVFAIIFALAAIFLGSTLLTLGSRCSWPLFWCYEIVLWSFVVLFSGTAYLLRRKASSVAFDEGGGGLNNIGIEMLEANPVAITSEVVASVNQSFKMWMGSSYLSSDDD
ncbi:uncharacterized protein LOC124927565 [Impatiens glandulifera]|uniref:uncharacterized protein LOC124927565 n=1 Tax=Impatiens glandulifera TaxID=253017 RepID=UPI001FB091B1|nr:uncharacterized protein LOC124927565 [Impatiens glandulifera]